MQKLAVVSLLIVGQVFAAPERFRRDAPVLPAWDVPTVGFEGRSEVFGSAGGFVGGEIRGEARYEGIQDEYGVPAEDYGVPHEDYGVPHEEYGPPIIVQDEVTPQ